LWDSWGLDASQYIPNFLTTLVNGGVPDNSKLDEVKKIEGFVGANKSGDPKNRMHVVVLCFTSAITEETTLLNQVKEMRGELTNQNITPVILLTHSDNIKPENRKLAQNQIAIAIGVPPANVYLVTNYVNEKKKSFTIDKENLSILHDLVKIGRTRIDHNISGEEENKI